MTGRRFAMQVRSGRAKARGAALTEFFWLTIILVPLLFGTAMIGKLVDVRQTAVQASRYVAWESTVDRAAEAGADVSDRFFAERSSEVRSAHADPADAGSTGVNALWGRRDRAEASMAGRTRVTVDASAVAPVDDRSVEGPTAATAMGDVVVAAGNALGALSESGGATTDWNLEPDGFLRRGVRVPVEGNAWLARRIGGCGTEDAYACLTELSVIMTDDWSAGDETLAENRARSLVPAGALDTVAGLVSFAGKLPVLKELGGLKDALGAVDVSALPATERGRRTLGDYDDATEDGS